MELYNNPANLFVAGFIGSPGMNFMPATLTNGSVHLPMADVTIPTEVRERLGRQPEGRRVIAGIRPEDFEDATKIDGDSRARSGEQAELWLDASKMHFFDEQSGEALTYAR
jgi:multiple sugar transport system ATP-binding protein